jgi:hypothetical protein
VPVIINPETGRGYVFKDRAGQRNGRLVFTRYVGRDEFKHSVWEARCDCGNLTETSSPHKTQSCGCLHREVAAATQRAKALPLELKRANARRNAANQRAKRKTDPLKAMQARLSRLHRHALAMVGAIKTSPTFEQLGYTVEEFVAHIERQFVKGMGWHNMGEWQIDHIVPVSEARTEQDVVALNQLSNLRPMWAAENNAKKARRTTIL